MRDMSYKHDLIRKFLSLTSYSVHQKCLTGKLNIAVTFRTFLAQIPFKYRQKGIKKLILIISTNSQDFKTKDQFPRE